jgi:hypothetical protein
MKTRSLLSLFFVMALCAAKAQFPAPANFDFTYDYIHIDDAGYCNGNYLIGPAYCTSFSWDAPDPASTTSTLSYYKVHYRYDNSFGGPAFDTIYVTTNNYLTINIGVIGWVWATAVYTNPDGESDSSNVQYNSTLPIGVPENEPAQPMIFTVDGSVHTVLIRHPEAVLQIRVLNAYGTCAEEIKPVTVKNYLENLKNGIYVIEATLRNHTKIYKKVIIS